VGEKATFNPLTQRIHIHSGELEIDVKVDLYSDAKEDWKDPATGFSKFEFPFTVSGGEPTVAGQFINPYFFMIEDWHLQPFEADHELTLVGNLFRTLGGSVAKPTSGEYTVSIDRLTTITLVEEGAGALTAGEIVDAMLDEPMASHVALGTVGATLADTAFQRAVYVDAVNGNPGTAFPRGTQGDPVDNLADAKTIASNRNSNKFRVMSNLTIGAGDNVSDYQFDGEGYIDALISVTAGATTQNTHFREVLLEGTLDGLVHLYGVTCEELFDFKGNAFNCVFMDNVTCVTHGGVTLFLNCYGGKTFADAVQVDIVDATVVFMGWQGPCKLAGKTGAQVIQFGMSNGWLIIENTCVAGTIEADGVGIIYEDNSGPGCTVITTGLMPSAISESIWALGLDRILGLMQENYYLDQTVYATYGGQKLLTSGRIRVYSVAGSVGTNNDVLATYLITASWSNDELQTYQVVKQ
jgi:hypothetical protein